MKEFKIKVKPRKYFIYGDKKYPENDVFKYTVNLNVDKVVKVYTKRLEVPEEFKEDRWSYYDKLEDYVQEKYFTEEKIEELKKYFIKEIEESENPFRIICSDSDSDYLIKEEEIFEID